MDKIKRHCEEQKEMKRAGATKQSHEYFSIVWGLLRPDEKIGTRNDGDVRRADLSNMTKNKHDKCG